MTRRFSWIVKFFLFSLAACAPAGAMGKVIEVRAGDSAGIQAALGQARPGDTVHFAAGLYAIVKPIQPISGVRITGEGDAKTVLQPAGKGKPFPLLDLSDKTDVEVCGLTLDGRDAARTDSGILAAHA